jgi:hypothetical protein
MKSKEEMKDLRDGIIEIKEKIKDLESRMPGSNLQSFSLSVTNNSQNSRK